MKLKELYEGTKKSDFPLSNAQSIKRWLHARNIPGYVNPDLSVDVPGNRPGLKGTDLSFLSLSRLPFQFGRVEGNFNCSHNKLKSLKGAPRFVGGYFVCQNNSLESLEYAPKEIGDRLFCAGNGPQLFHNVHRYIKRVGNDIEFGHEINSYLLGLMKIEGISTIWISAIPAPGIHTHIPKLNAAVGILNKHLNKPARDIHACQEELIEAGLKEYARL